MEKDYGIRVSLEFDYGVSAETYEGAVQVVKSIFEEKHNIELKDEEIDRQSELHDFIDRQANLWDDLQTIEQECLSGNETLVDWLQAELLELVRLHKKENK